MKSVWKPAARCSTGLGLLLLFCAGCGPGGGHVSGKVLLKDGSPLPGGTITFYPEGGKGNPASGPIHPDGTYDVRAVPLGAVKVTVSNLGLKEGARGPTGMAAVDTGSKKPNMADAQKAPKQGPPRGIQVGPPREAMAQMAQKPPEAGGASEKEGKYVPIDFKYADAGTSPLKCEVHRGDQEQDFHLE